jgi:hypothetical protein
MTTRPRFLEGDVVMTEHGEATVERTFMQTVMGRPGVGARVGSAGSMALFTIDEMTLLRRPVRVGDVVLLKINGAMHTITADDLDPKWPKADWAAWTHVDGTAIEPHVAEVAPAAAPKVRPLFRVDDIVREGNGPERVVVGTKLRKSAALGTEQNVQIAIGMTTAWVHADSLALRRRPVRLRDVLRHSDGTVLEPFTEADMRTYERNGGAAEGWAHADGTEIEPPREKAVVNSTGRVVGHVVRACKVEPGKVYDVYIGGGGGGGWEAPKGVVGVWIEGDGVGAGAGGGGTVSYPAQLKALEGAAREAPVGMLVHPELKPGESTIYNKSGCSATLRADGSMVVRTRDNEMTISADGFLFSAPAAAAAPTGTHHCRLCAGPCAPDVDRTARLLFETDAEVIAYVRGRSDSHVRATYARWSTDLGRSETVKDPLMGYTKLDGTVERHTQTAWTLGGAGNKPDATKAQRESTEAKLWKRAMDRATAMHAKAGGGR